VRGIPIALAEEAAAAALASATAADAESELHRRLVAALGDILDEGDGLSGPPGDGMIQDSGRA
jgi:hypothetical protein